MNRQSMVCVLLASIVLAACAGLPTTPIDADSLVLAPGSLVMMGRIEREGFTFHLVPLSPLPQLPDKIRILSPVENLQSASLLDIIKKTLAQQPADMVLLVQSDARFEKGYNPRQVFAGWRTESVFDGHIDGRAVYRMRDTPEFRTEYGNRCVRLTYRVYQYGPDAEPLGRMDIAPQPRAHCPEKSDTDLTLDEIDDLVRWIEENIRLSPQSP